MSDGVILPSAVTETWAPKGSFSRRAGGLIAGAGSLAEYLAVIVSAVHRNYIPLALTVLGLAGGAPAALVRMRGVERGDRKLEITGAAGQCLVFAATAAAGASMIFGPIAAAAYLTYGSWVARTFGTGLSVDNPGGWTLTRRA